MLPQVYSKVLCERLLPGETRRLEGTVSDPFILEELEPSFGGDDVRVESVVVGRMKLYDRSGRWCSWHAMRVPGGMPIFVEVQNHGPAPAAFGCALKGRPFEAAAPKIAKRARALIRAKNTSNVGQELALRFEGAVDVDGLDNASFQTFAAFLEPGQALEETVELAGLEYIDRIHILPQSRTLHITVTPLS